MALDAWLRANFEPLQYAAFFGALAIIASFEALTPLRETPGGRRGRWPANFGLTLINIIVISAVPVSGLAAADVAASHGHGLFNVLGAGGMLALAAGLLARSLTNYAVHVAMHKVPLLWRLHRVHHSDQGLDVSTAVRFHPLEFAIQVPVALASIYSLGIPPVAIIVYELLDAAMAAWTHANVRLPQAAERLLGVVLVTPGMHRIHHSARQSETDSNYGATLSIWDRLFGTLKVRNTPQLLAIKIGLEECQDSRSRSFLWLLRLPFIRLLAESSDRRQS